MKSSLKQILILRTSINCIFERVQEIGKILYYLLLLCMQLKGDDTETRTSFNEKFVFHSESQGFIDLNLKCNFFRWLYCQLCSFARLEVQYLVWRYFSPQNSLGIIQRMLQNILKLEKILLRYGTKITSF